MRNSLPTAQSQATLFQLSPREAGIEHIHFATALYTTASVVDRILDRSGWPECGGGLLDPSAGDGAFLVSALRRLRPEPGDHVAVSRVQGYEFHSGAVLDGRRRVAQCLRDLGWGDVEAGDAAARIVEERDFLLHGPAPGTFQAIVGNPPYLRYARLPEYFKRLYAEILPRHAVGDLMHAFIDRCAAIMTPTSSIHLVCADRFLFNQSAAELRAAIGRRVGIAHLARLDASTSFYRPKDRRAGTLPRVHPVEVHFLPAAAAPFAITAAPISPDGHDATPHRGPTLAAIAQVRVAPWLGPAGIFLLDEQRAAALPHSELLPAVDTDDIDPRTDTLLRPHRYAIRTRRDLEPVGMVREHLLANVSRMPERGRRGRWWVPPETINLPLDRPGLLVPRIARRLRAIPLPAGVLPVNHNLSVVAATGAVSLDEIREVLVSDDAQHWLERHAPRLENGFYSITTSLLRRLPIPPALADRAQPLPQAA